MSTKIYYVYRLKKQDLPLFLNRIRAVSKILKKAALHNIVRGLHDVFTKNPQYRNLKDYLPSYFTEKNYVFCKTNKEVHIQLSIQQKYVYVRFSGDVGGVNCCVDVVDDLVEEYHWQNQTDRPKSIPAKAWYERKRTWERILDDWSFENWLSITVVPDFIMDTFSLPSCLAWFDASTPERRKESLEDILQYLKEGL